MSTREGIRPGGRSARVQESVHKAVRDLTAEIGRANVTVPMIAARAGVTPSTIYRRWGDLAELLADVALERLRPDATPIDTGDVYADLRTWAEQFFEEMTSEPGKAMVRDVIACAAASGEQAQCGAYVREQIQAILDRAAQRGQSVPDADTIMDHYVAPVMYRNLFYSAPITAQRARELMEDCLKQAPR